jgi:hypothetical protein
VGEGGHEVLPVFRPATGLEKKKGTFRRHTSMKLWALQFDSEFLALDVKYF